MFSRLTRRSGISLGITLLFCLLFLAINGAIAQEPPPGDRPQEEGSDVSVAAAVNSRITYQGVLEEDGSPVDGTRDFTFDFFADDACSGAAVYHIVESGVPIDDGFFDVDVDVTQGVFDGEGVWLQVTVGSTVLGCEEILPVPYALSLRPGATIVGEEAGTTFGDATLNVENASAPHLGPMAGIFARSATGSAVRAESDAVGVYAESEFEPAVFARSAATAGRFQSDEGYGIRVNADGADHWDHAGYFTANWGNGLFVTSAHNIGVRAESSLIAVRGSSVGGTGISGSGETGVSGWSDSGYGVQGDSPSGTCVSGHTWTNDDFGVVGTQSGYATSDLDGFFESGGLFGGENGVVGITKHDAGFAVFGYNRAAASGWAGTFVAENGNGVQVSTPSGQTGLTVIGGSKNALVATDDGARYLYSEESTGVWFTDYGFGVLEGGETTVEIDPVFAQTVNLDRPYHVFVEPYGPASLYVTDRASARFTVRAREGDPDVEFSYRLVATRLGYEDHRVERAPWADNDPHLYPERAGVMKQAPPGGE
jgi:hypothetical protein